MGWEQRATPAPPADARRNRARVLQFRPAPLCAHYLGYPGTLGSPDVDYLIADSYVIPSGAESSFHEAVVRLPGCYQANDDQRAYNGARTATGSHGATAESTPKRSMNQAGPATAMASM